MIAYQTTIDESLLHHFAPAKDDYSDGRLKTPCNHAPGFDKPIKWNQDLQKREENTLLGPIWIDNVRGSAFYEAKMPKGEFGREELFPKWQLHYK